MHPLAGASDIVVLTVEPAVTYRLSLFQVLTTTACTVKLKHEWVIPPFAPPARLLPEVEGSAPYAQDAGDYEYTEHDVPWRGYALRIPRAPENFSDRQLIICYRIFFNGKIPI